MQKSIFNLLLILSFTLAASTVSAHDAEHQATLGYIGDVSGHIARDRDGNCLHTIYFNKAKHGVAECGEGPAEKVAKSEPEPAPEPAPAPAPVVHEAITLHAHTLFDIDKSTLRNTGMDELDSVAAKLKSYHSHSNIHVTGHTDSTGTTEYNQSLSERRAAAVKAYLVSKGINSNAVITNGAGETRPIATNKTSQGRQQNRRVEINITARK